MSSNRSLRLHSSVALCTLLSMFGCTAGQTGGQVSVGPDEAGFSCVDVETTLLDEETTSPLGFSAKDILHFVAQAHAIPVNWQPETLNGVRLDVTPASGESELQMTVRYTGGEIQHIERDQKSNKGQEPAIQPFPDPGASCPDLLSIEVEVDVSMSNGAFNDTFTARLIAYSQDQASLFISFSPDDLEGSFAVEVIEPEGAEATEFRITATFSPDHFSGRVDGLIEHRNDETVAATWIGFTGGDATGNEPRK